ncbi:MAG: hypothetical protein RL172_1193 [Bacteroidota bacterium]|jgi:hypothetical protein
MKQVFFAGCMALASLSASAQSYSKALGLRLGPNSAAVTAGFTGKYFLNERTAVEGIIGINDGLGICALYQIHFPIAAVNNLQWFAGPGAYVAFRNSTTMVGAAGIVGLDYKFEELPINLTLDWKPELNLLSKIAFESSGLGLSVRYTF